MKRKRRKIDFVNVIINLILITIVAGLAMFVYYCMKNDIQIEIAEFSDGTGISKIINLEKPTKIELDNTKNPLYAMEVVNPDAEENINFIGNGYYYKQIDDNAKIIYQELEKNIDNLKTGNYTIEFGKTFNDLLNQEGGAKSLNDSYQQALDAFSLDRPDVFYIDISKMLLMIYSRKTIIKTTYTVSIKSEENSSYLSEGFKDKKEIDTAYAQLENVKLRLQSQLTGDSYNKVKQIHDWLINNIEYEETISKVNIRNIYGALINKEVVCEGYAKSFKYILDDLEIPNIIVVGTATNSNNQTESHAWNYVYINDRWYAIDATWDDPIVVGGGRLPEKEKYKYFLKGEKNFNVNHNPIGRVSDKGIIFTYPKLNLEDYK